MALEDERQEKCSCLTSPVYTQGFESLTSIDEMCLASFDIESVSKIPRRRKAVPFKILENYTSLTVKSALFFFTLFVLQFVAD